MDTTRLREHTTQRHQEIRRGRKRRERDTAREGDGVGWRERQRERLGDSGKGGERHCRDGEREIKRDT